MLTTCSFITFAILFYQVGIGVSIVLHLVTLPDTTESAAPCETCGSGYSVSYDPRSVAAARHWLYMQQSTASACTEPSDTNSASAPIDTDATTPVELASAMHTHAVETTFLQAASGLTAAGGSTLGTSNNASQGHIISYTHITTTHHTLYFLSHSNVFVSYSIITVRTLLLH